MLQTLAESSLPSVAVPIEHRSISDGFGTGNALTAALASACVAKGWLVWAGPCSCCNSRKRWTVTSSSTDIPTLSRHDGCRPGLILLESGSHHGNHLDRDTIALMSKQTTLGTVGCQFLGALSTSVSVGWNVVGVKNTFRGNFRKSCHVRAILHDSVLNYSK